MFLYVQKHEIAFSDNQEWNGDEDNVRVHCSRGPVACTKTTSDDAKARTERQTAEMATMVKKALRQSFCSVEVEQPFILYPREAQVARIEGQMSKLPRRLEAQRLTMGLHMWYRRAGECLFPL
jgi:hypothetical protein